MPLTDLFVLSGPRGRACADRWASDLPGSLAALGLRDVRVRREELAVWPALPQHGGVLPTLDEAALIVLHDEDHAALSRALDVMIERQLPALVLTADPGAGRRGLEAAGIHCDALDAPPERVSAALWALCSRQPAVFALQRELSALRRSSGGLRGEMDRIHEELNLAAGVQREFLPKSIPTIDGLDFGVLFRPCGYVSGDIYAVRAVDDRRVAMFVADAVGHGVPAALLTVVLANALATQPGDDGPDLPKRALERLNRAMCEQQLSASRFATAVYAVIDTRTHEATIAGAGHPPPMIIGNGRFETLETEGPLLGVFAEAEFTQASAVIRPGEMMVLYTDGFETACPTPDASGKVRTRANTRYIDHLRALADGIRPEERPAHTLADRLGALLDEQAGSLHQLDDITALAVAPTRDADALRISAAA